MGNMGTPEPRISRGGVVKTKRETVVLVVS